MGWGWRRGEGRFIYKGGKGKKDKGKKDKKKRAERKAQEKFSGGEI
jgi:hypothetical protein